MKLESVFSKVVLPHPVPPLMRTLSRALIQASINIAISGVRDNRRLYAEKFDKVTPIIARHLQTAWPDAGFYLWARTPCSDTEFTVDLLRKGNVAVVPGSYLARTADGVNPGAGFIRIRGATTVMNAGENFTIKVGGPDTAHSVVVIESGIRLGLLDNQVDVDTHGGRLTVAWPGAQGEAWAPVLMTGPATTVFEGEIDIPTL
jgi:hypothetical protein